MGICWVRSAPCLPQITLFTDHCDVETQYDNFGDDVDMPNRVMEGEFMRTNPIGHDFDPEELWKQLQAEGENATLRKQQHPVESGEARGLESIPAAYMT